LRLTPLKAENYSLAGAPQLFLGSLELAAALPVKGYTNGLRQKGNDCLEEKKHPCSSCFLSEFAPPEVRNSTGDICHKIPLNEKGDTVESLKAEDDPQKLQTAVLGWLKRTVAKLEEEVVVKE